MLLLISLIGRSVMAIHDCHMLAMNDILSQFSVLGPLLEDVSLKIAALDTVRLVAGGLDVAHCDPSRVLGL